MNLAVVALAFLWGWAEATWFFVVPDLWLTFAVFWGRSTAMSAVLAALAGSLAGAVHFFWLDETSRQLLQQWWQVTPGYAPSMAGAIAQHLQWGPAGLCHGPWLGIPYRYYLGQAHTLQFPLLSVCLWTLWARLPRLILAPLVAGAFYSLLRAQSAQLGLSDNWKRPLALLFASVWVAIYVDYWFFYVPKTYS
ncbi:hypothetical protein IV102_16550 [bacterium]|nr:hypothetical protein [bacterium]